MKLIDQIVAISLLNVRNIPSRLGSSAVVVVGVSGVVVVLVAVLSMAQGFSATLQGTARADRALILRTGASSEMDSWFTLAEAAIVESQPGIKRGKMGFMAAKETWASARVARHDGEGDATLPLRGVVANSFRTRPEVAIVAGRNLELGKFELIAGIGAASASKGIAVGQKLRMRGVSWEIVGLFSAAGGIFESELWVDNDLLLGRLNRGGTITSMMVQLESSGSLDALANALKRDPRLTTVAIGEPQYYAAQSDRLARFIEVFGYGIATLMAIGAIFAALDAMYTAISSRAVEIATLRAIGFQGVPTIVLSVLVESLLLALIGGAIGGTAAYLLFDGYATTTMAANFSQVAFDLKVTSETLVVGIAWACAVGAIGGFAPAIRAARAPITTALRGLD